MSTKNKIGFGIIICLLIAATVVSIVGIFIEGGIVALIAYLTIVSLVVTGCVLAFL
ncbi:hypothetical protein MUDAN_DOGOELCO_03300 [Lactiplantibacillus mudanjiangensis]|uniref:hypothetical protein n=1 Tax=Lactiplantibacillus mudanjiangensis TaxID=1296538 RepID=UPI001014D000|nr:hypothetical protein [Lactiplantibacillus mudanjiangensis]VDG31456.1 hypothetical protein MUDAN_DOGOELCO_03300 [Lactiplantibacillus mudanjiangensis]